MRLLLESHPGWEVCGEAADGQDGVEKAQQLNPDLIVLDMSIPVMDASRWRRLWRT